MNLNYADKKQVAMIKILQHHNDFDMIPFFEWEFKLLPFITNWFKRASSVTMPEGYEPKIEPRKLSSIYQFIRGMPVLYIETRLRKELDDIKAEESQTDGGSSERKQQLQDRKRSIMERLEPQQGGTLS